MKVISIQSQVAHGHVGNSAAVYPMQALGVEVAAVPTVLLSNHPRYPTVHGQKLDPALVAALLTGLEERGWADQAQVLLTGYLGSVEVAEVVAGFAEAWTRRNPALQLVCDPVMGDDDSGVFVAPALPDLFRTRLVPLAHHITPNQFELGLLAGQPVTTEAGLVEAVAKVVRPGAVAVVTGCTLEDTPPGTVETVVCGARILSRSPVRKLPMRPCGTGDMLAGLYSAALCRGETAGAAGAIATRSIHDVLLRTEAAGTEEMQVIGHDFLASAKAAKAQLAA